MEEEQIPYIDRLRNKFDVYAEEVRQNQERIAKELDTLFW